MQTQTAVSKPAWWTGTILKVLLCLFLAFDCTLKVIKSQPAIDGTKQLGLPEDCIQFLGGYLLLGTILYIYPKTVLTGMLLLVAYLGGAVAIGYRAGLSGHPYMFPLVFAFLIVVAEFLRNAKLRNVLPVIK